MRWSAVRDLAIWLRASWPPGGLLPWSVPGVIVVFAILFFGTVNIGLFKRVGSEEAYEARALILIEESPSFSVARTPRSLVGLVRDAKDVVGPAGRLIVPIEGTPLAWAVGRAGTRAEARTDADERAAAAVAELNRLNEQGFRARVVAGAGPAFSASSLPSRPRLAIMAALAAGSLTSAGMLVEAARRSGRRRSRRPVWSS